MAYRNVIIHDPVTAGFQKRNASLQVDDATGDVKFANTTTLNGINYTWPNTDPVTGQVLSATLDSPGNVTLTWEDDLFGGYGYGISDAFEALSDGVNTYAADGSDTILFSGAGGITVSVDPMTGEVEVDGTGVSGSGGGGLAYTTGMVGVAGDYIPINMIFDRAFTATATPADTIYTFPVILSRNLTVDRIAYEVVATNASAKMKLAIYDDTGAGGLPGALIDASPELNLTPAGLQEWTKSYTFTAGVIYWFAIHCSRASGTVRRVSSGSALPIKMDSTGTGVDTNAYLDRAYASGFPDPFGTPTGYISANCTVIRVRLA